MSTDSLNDLISAAQAVIDRWDSPSWKDLPATADYIHRLRKAVAEAKPSEISVVDKYKETIRCMSQVFDDLALELGIPPHEYGEPDLLFDAIEKLKATKPVSNAVGDKLSPVEQSDVVGRWKSLTDSLEKKVPAAKQPVQQPPWKDMASGYYYLDAGSLTGPCQVEPIKRESVAVLCKCGCHFIRDKHHLIVTAGHQCPECQMMVFNTEIEGEKSDES